MVMLVSSCETVIDLDLKNGDPKLVVEGNIELGSGPFYITLSQTTPISDAGGIDYVSSAEVIITGSDGQVDTLDETTLGVYETSDITGIEGVAYSLKITHNEEVYEATSTMPKLTVLDSLSYENPGGLFGDEKTFQYFAYFTDDAAEDNFYFTRAFSKDGLEDESPFDDQLINGNDVQIFVTFVSEVESGDTISVELYTIDKGVYDYYNTIEFATGSGDGSQPGDPISNISNEGLGYFSAQTKSTKEIIMP